MTSFESTKSDLVSSSLGQSLGLTTDSLWSAIVTAIKSVVTFLSGSQSVTTSGKWGMSTKNGFWLYIPNNGYLVKWAKQGVMMLNTVLTVRAHAANSHHGIGWEEFTDAAIKILNEQDRPIVFILWGRPAQAKKAMLNNPKHLILEAPHPSPLSAYRGFFGSRPFSKTNAFLEEHGLSPIDWQIENVEKDK